MLRFLLQSGLSPSEVLLLGAMLAVVLAYSLSVHEFMHGYAAYKLGDDTAKLKGRLTMNPIAHLDPMGAIMFFIIGFGWAKPVPVNYNRLTRFKNRSTSIRIVSVAGVTANFVSAFIAYTLYTLIMIMTAQFNISLWNNAVLMGLNIFIQLLMLLFEFNLLLMAFNLLPFPPLDGYHILETIIPYKYRNRLYKYERKFSYILLGLIVMGFFFAFSPLFWLVNTIKTPFAFIIQYPLDLLRLLFVA